MRSQPQLSCNMILLFGVSSLLMLSITSSTYAAVDAVEEHQQGVKGPRQARALRTALKHQKAFNHIFESCLAVVDYGDVGIFLKQLEECLFRRYAKAVSNNLKREEKNWN